MEEGRQAQIAVVDHDRAFREVVAGILDSFGHQAVGFGALREAETALIERSFDAILLAHDLEGEDSVALLELLHRVAPGTPVLVVTPDRATDVAMRAVHAGAADFVPRPIDEARLFASLSQAISQRELRSALEGPEESPGGMVGRCAAMRIAFRTIRHVAAADVPVLVRGEPGTGKRLVARAIHELSRRGRGPFVAMDLAALPGDRIEAAMFGAEDDVAAVAPRPRVGACEESAGGTLFLDEICAIPGELQAKLLRFSQEGVLRRVGGEKPISSSPRIVSATQADPHRAIRDGSLREDLFYRLSVVPIELPALRDRGPEDIALLAHRALLTTSVRYARSFDEIAPDALAALVGYSWPGNCRQLEEAIEQAVILHKGPRLSLGMLPPELVHSVAADWPPTILRPMPRRVEGPPSRETQPLDVVERHAIVNAVRRHEGSVTAAAAALKISAATIYRKLRRYGLRPEDLR
ncbi:MAG: sigma-54 dependent transcriptional regulator [Planctomycetota bacterium]